MGTETEWLASLIGPQGAQGEPGADGADGIDGINGLDGADGAQGPKGDTGDTGPQGPQGDAGPQGPQGDAGATGPQGDPGVGIPTGGDAGQILAKLDGTDYNTTWIDNYANWTSQVKHEVKLGEAIAKGQAVYVSSADGTNMIVSKASNATEATSSKTLGLLELGGSTNAKVKLIAEGLLSGLDTSTATAGDPVWLGTAGNLIYGLTNKPVAPAHLVFIGVVTRAQSSNGEIFVKPQNGFEFNELHDVLIQSPADNEVMAYDSASSLWKNQTLEEAGIMPNVDAKLNRTNSVSEGGQIDFARASDNAVAWGIDAYGSTSTPDLRFIEGVNTRVTFNAGGDLTLGGAVNSSRIRLSSTTDASASSTDHAFQIGESNTSNLRIDANEVSAFNNGSVATLFLNTDGGTVQFGGLLDSNDTYANEITTTRRAMWMSSAGVFGYASSSRERKQDIAEAELDVEAILSIEPKFFRYIGAVEEFGDDAPVELGMIAEDLHDAGLTQIVDYGKNGKIEGIHYSMYVTALQAVVRHQATQISELAARLDALEAK
jgi:hypothetical protein